MKALYHEVVVSCQALPEEPLHSSFIMGRMAYAAYLGGARGIRANSVEDIREIKKTVDLPIIGSLKKSMKAVMSLSHRHLPKSMLFMRKVLILSHWMPQIE